MDLREIDLIKSQTDSIAITNFDQDNNQINQVEMQPDPFISTDDTIPNEDFNEKVSAYVLPEKQISIRKLSVNRQESERGRQAGQSCGPKLRFDNKIEWKSRSQSKRAIIPNNWRSNKFDRCLNIDAEKYNFQAKHQPKICANQLINQMNIQPSKIKIQKPPLCNAPINSVNINRISYSSRAPVDQWKRTSSYQSLVLASEKLK